MKKVSMVVLALSLLAFAGCGDSGGSGGGGGNNGGNNGGELDGPLDAQAFMQKLDEIQAEAYCKTVFNDCPDKVKLNFWSGETDRAASQQECIDYLLESSYQFAPSSTVPDMVASGRVTFDEAKARTCLQEMQQSSDADACWSPVEGPSATCREVFSGTVADGEPCKTDVACQSGFCLPAFATDHTDTCYGECSSQRTFVSQGDECDTYEFNYACDPTQNLVCEPDPSDPNEERTICVPMYSRQKGQPCDADVACAEGLTCDDYTCVELQPGDVGDDCTADEYPPKPCKPELVCGNVSGGTGQGTCIEPAAEGDSCVDTRDCAVGLYCADDGTCAPQKAAGEPCDARDACAGRMQCDGMGADQSGTCADRGSYDSCTLPAGGASSGQ